MAVRMPADNKNRTFLKNGYAYFWIRRYNPVAGSFMISIVLGTRPEIIKMAPVIRACRQKGIGYSVLHTGQHYSYEMDRIFFEDPGLSSPD
jgi:hypothetical protein